jgi:hypothetical protein
MLIPQGLRWQAFLPESDVDLSQSVLKYEQSHLFLCKSK